MKAFELPLSGWMGLKMNDPRQPMHARCQRKTIGRWGSFSAMNASQLSTKQRSLTQTQHPNALPASWHCPGQHKGVVSRVCFTSARPDRLRSWTRLPSYVARNHSVAFISSQGGKISATASDSVRSSILIVFPIARRNCFLGSPCPTIHRNMGVWKP